MTNLQYGTLKYLINHEVSIEDLRIYNLTTLGSLLQRGYLQRQGTKLAVTEKGIEAYQLYHTGGPNYRQREGELSERVRLMLHLRMLSVAKAS